MSFNIIVCRVVFLIHFSSSRLIPFLVTVAASDDNDAMEAGLRSFFAKELLSEDAGPPIRPDFVATASFSRKTDATIENFPTLFSSSSDDFPDGRRPPDLCRKDNL